MEKNLNKQIAGNNQPQINNNLDKVTVNELALEIVPIINDFFCGSISVDNCK